MNPPVMSFFLAFTPNFKQNECSKNISFLGYSMLGLALNVNTGIFRFSKILYLHFIANCEWWVWAEIVFPIEPHFFSFNFLLCRFFFLSSFLLFIVLSRIMRANNGQTIEFPQFRSEWENEKKKWKKKKLLQPQSIVGFSVHYFLIQIARSQRILLLSLLGSIFCTELHSLSLLDTTINLMRSHLQVNFIFIPLQSKWPT